MMMKNNDESDILNNQEEVESPRLSKSQMQEILAGTGRNIDEIGGFDVEISEKRTPQEIAENRPGPKLREKILNLIALLEICNKAAAAAEALGRIAAFPQ